jgi:hypothetical protein
MKMLKVTQQLQRVRLLLLPLHHQAKNSQLLPLLLLLLS